MEAADRRGHRSAANNRVAVDKSDFHSFSSKRPVHVVMRTGAHRVSLCNRGVETQTIDVYVDGDGTFVVSQSLSFRYRLEFEPN